MSWTTKVKRLESYHQLKPVKYTDNNILFNYNSKKWNDLCCGIQPRSLFLFTHKMLYPRGSFSSLTPNKIQIIAGNGIFLPVNDIFLTGKFSLWQEGLLFSSQQWKTRKGFSQLQERG